MMKRIGLACVVLLIFQLGQSATSDVISCGRFTQIEWKVVGRVKTCQISAKMISSERVSISPVDSSVLTLDMRDNRNISFLPIRVDETFPNLAAYNADDCSLKTVSKVNLRNLKKLRYLSLSRNQIEKIDTDTFEDVTSLELLFLDDNKIKQMNGAVFAGLRKLTKIYLKGNICINRDFSDTARASTDVSENCGFMITKLLETISRQQNEQKVRIDSLNENVMKENKELSNEVANLKAQLATYKGLKQQSDVTVRYLSKEVTRITAESSAAKASLSSAADVSQQLENQISMMTSLHSKLENSWELTCKAQTKDLTENVQRKGDEIDGLVEEQIKLRSEVNEKRTKLEYLQAKLNDLNC